MKTDFKSEKYQTLKVKNMPQICYICDKHLSNKYSLKRHLKTVHNVNRFHVCNVCSKQFNNRVSLQMHKKIHFKPVKKKQSSSSISSKSAGPSKSKKRKLENKRKKELVIKRNEIEQCLFDIDKETVLTAIEEDEIRQITNSYWEGIKTHFW